MVLHKAIFNYLTLAKVCFCCLSLPLLPAFLNVRETSMAETLFTRQVHGLVSSESLEEASKTNHYLNAKHITTGVPEVAKSEVAPEDLDDGDSMTDSLHELSEMEVREMRLNMFQYTFTEMLRANNINISQIVGSQQELSKYPEELLGEMFKHGEDEEDFEDDFFAKDKEVIIRGDDIGHDCTNMNNTLLGCYTFNLKVLKNSSIHSVKLWFYKERVGHVVHKPELFIYDLGSNTRRYPVQHSIIFSRELDSKDDWVAMDITHQAKKWMGEGANTRTLAFQCNTCNSKHHSELYGTEDGYAPILVVTYSRSKNERRRARRSREKCDFKKECCHRRLFADFKYVTAVTGLVQLPQLDIGYCFGRCEKSFTILLDRGHWKQVMSGMPENKVRWLRKKRLPCCAPTSMMSVALRQKMGQRIVERVFDDMIVKTCGCVM